MNTKKTPLDNVIFVLVFILAVLFLAPIFIVFMNSFKGNSLSLTRLLRYPMLKRLLV